MNENHLQGRNETDTGNLGEKVLSSLSNESSHWNSFLLSKLRVSAPILCAPVVYL